MTETLDRLYDTLCRALDKVSEEKLTATSLDNIFKIVGTIYKLEKLDMGMEDDGYSLDGGSYARGSYNSYARGRGRNAKRDSMGRYSREGGSNMSNDSYDSYARGSYERGYSREGSYHKKEDIRRELQELMNEAEDQPTKQMIQKWISEIDK